jgi:hypothetical protein
VRRARVTVTGSTQMKKIQASLVRAGVAQQERELLAGVELQMQARGTADMAKLMVLNNKLADAAAFDAYYFSKHVLMAILLFDSVDAIGAAFGSKEGQATADLANFAHVGA